MKISNAVDNKRRWRHKSSNRLLTHNSFPRNLLLSMTKKISKRKTRKFLLHNYKNSLSNNKKMSTSKTGRSWIGKKRKISKSSMRKKTRMKASRPYRSLKIRCLILLNLSSRWSQTDSSSSIFLSRKYSARNVKSLTNSKGSQTWL